VVYVRPLALALDLQTSHYAVHFGSKEKPKIRSSAYFNTSLDIRLQTTDTESFVRSITRMASRMECATTVPQATGCSTRLDGSLHRKVHDFATSKEFLLARLFYGALSRRRFEPRSRFLTGKIPGWRDVLNADLSDLNYGPP
jgi:hypothetical protein